MKFTIKGQLHVREEARCTAAGEITNDFVCYVLPYCSDNSVFGVHVGPVECEAELPGNLPNIRALMTAAEIAELEREKANAARTFADACTRINRRLAELQAVEMSEPAPCAAG